MGCPPVTAIVDFARGDLKLGERAQVEAHVADCAECRVALSELLRVGAAPDEGVAEPLRPLLPRGATVGRYVLSERLGAGAWGVVYAAYDPQLDRPVALKLLNGRARSQAGALQLLGEARMLARLAHPNVVVVHDAGLFQGRPYIVMERVVGDNLRKWLGQPRSSRELIEVFSRVGIGLEAAHAAGITHRDFKPSNVLIGVDGRPRVADFGLSSVTQSDDGDDAVAGTLAYMAPEQRAGAGSDARADQFSFCVALWEALNGARPDGPAGPQPPAGSAVPRRVTRALARGMAVDPAARFPSMRALLAAMEPPSRVPYWVASALALVSATAVLFWHHDRPPVDRVCRWETRRMGALWQERRPAVEHALSARGGAGLQSVGANARIWLRNWVTVRIGVCEDAKATDARGRARFAQRMACIDERRARLGAILDDLVARGDVAAAGSALSALPIPTDCLKE